MPRGIPLPRVYLRIDPAMDEHPEWEWLMRLIFSANRQPQRGRFRDEARVRRILRTEQRFQRFLERRDLVRTEDGLYLEGWDEWQEGDLTVGERVKRLRERRKRAQILQLPLGETAEKRRGNG